MFDSIALPPYPSLKRYEGKGNWAIKKYYQWPYSLFYRHKLKMIVEMLGKKKHNNILDFGAGPGIFTKELSKHAISVKSFDLGDVMDLRWKFDVIVCASVLEFVPLEHTLKLLKALMKPKGILIVGSPMDSKFSRAYFKFIKDKNTRYSHQEIIEAMEKVFGIVAEKSWMNLYFTAKAWN